MSEEAERLRGLPIHVIIGSEVGSNRFLGACRRLIGNDMEWKVDRVAVWPTGKYGLFNQDGYATAERVAMLLRLGLPDWVVTVYDARDPHCPIEVDITRWSMDHAMGGLSRRYEGANARFKMKEYAQ